MTYKELLELLQKMNPNQLAQEVQVETYTYANPIVKPKSLDILENEPVLK